MDHHQSLPKSNSTEQDQSKGAIRKNPKVQSNVAKKLDRSDPQTASTTKAYMAPSTSSKQGNLNDPGTLKHHEEGISSSLLVDDYELECSSEEDSTKKNDSSSIDSDDPIAKTVREFHTSLAYTLLSLGLTDPPEVKELMDEIISQRANDATPPAEVDPDVVNAPGATRTSNNAGNERIPTLLDEEKIKRLFKLKPPGKRVDQSVSMRFFKMLSKSPLEDRNFKKNNKIFERNLKDIWTGKVDVNINEISQTLSTRNGGVHEKLIKYMFSNSLLKECNPKTDERIKAVDNDDNAGSNDITFMDIDPELIARLEAEPLPMPPCQECGDSTAPTKLTRRKKFANNRAERLAKLKKNRR